MTIHNRLTSHRRLRSRGFKDFISEIFNDASSTTAPSGTSTSQTSSQTPSTDTTTKTRGNNGNNDGNDGNNGHGPRPSTTSIDQQSSPTDSIATTTSKPHGKPAPTTTTTSTEQSESSSTSTSIKETSTIPATTSTTSSSSSSTVILTSTLPKPTSTTPVTITAPPVTRTHTDGVGSITSDPIFTASSTPSTAPSSGLSTGAIVGSVAGGIVGLVAIFFIVAFLLRRWRRNRIHDQDFNPEDFVRASNMTETGNGYNNNPFEPTPPNPAFRHHSIAPSIGSGPNMAGQGAYAYGNDTAYTDATYAGGGVTAYGTAAGAAAYGTYEAHTNDDAINGAYSSQPTPQEAYNSEAYGSYAYSPNGSHAVTTGTQHAHPYSGTEYQAHYQDNVPASAPALVAGAPAVPANRAPSVYNVDDAYGGI